MTLSVYRGLRLPAPRGPTLPGCRGPLRRELLPQPGPGHFDSPGLTQKPRHHRKGKQRSKFIRGPGACGKRSPCADPCLRRRLPLRVFQARERQLVVPDCKQQRPCFRQKVSESSIDTDQDTRGSCPRIPELQNCSNQTLQKLHRASFDHSLQWVTTALPQDHWSQHDTFTVTVQLRHTNGPAPTRSGGPNRGLSRASPVCKHPWPVTGAPTHNHTTHERSYRNAHTNTITHSSSPAGDLHTALGLLPPQAPSASQEPGSPAVSSSRIQTGSPQLTTRKTTARSTEKGAGSSEKCSLNRNSAAVGANGGERSGRHRSALNYPPRRLLGTQAHARVRRRRRLTLGRG
ncbi:uncharacterized protein LOC108287820 [Cebus imitator]|uniref:uncharacterized protein LOC108287820 n=1 Tax=Cebus imitator TaxID=2715852 RepID=UPI00080A5B37|nr:uncharacterized protein LOC108287820 [Cebus imitator]